MRALTVPILSAAGLLASCNDRPTATVNAANVSVEAIPPGVERCGIEPIG